MAQLIGGLATSHVPAIGNAIARQLKEDPYWKPFFDGFLPVHDWLARIRPDTAVVFYNDHGLNFFLDKMPTFAIGAAEEYPNADEGWGIPTLPPSRGTLDLSWHLVEELIRHEFDMVTCQEMLLDHAATLPLKLFWPDEEVAPVQIVPISINTVLFPLPTARRCYRLGQVVGEAIRSWEADKRVAVIGTGGLSHQLEGQRAGHINKKFDLQFLESMVTNPEWAVRFSDREIVAEVGTQGAELLNWLAMRGALSAGGHGVRQVHRSYHIPISNTATGVLALQTVA